MSAVFALYLAQHAAMRWPVRVSYALVGAMPRAACPAQGQTLQACRDAHAVPFDVRFLQGTLVRGIDSVTISAQGFHCWPHISIET